MRQLLGSGGSSISLIHAAAAVLSQPANVFGTEDAQCNRVNQPLPLRLPKVLLWPGLAGCAAIVGRTAARLRSFAPRSTRPRAAYEIAANPPPQPFPLTGTNGNPHQATATYDSTAQAMACMVPGTQPIVGLAASLTSADHQAVQLDADLVAIKKRPGRPRLPALVLDRKCTLLLEQPRIRYKQWVKLSRDPWAVSRRT